MKKFNPFKRKKNINYPFSRGKGRDAPGTQSNHEAEEKKTRMGLQSELPFLDQPDKSQDDFIKCPECQYPLRIEPSAASPCPNCGFSDVHTTPQDTIAESGKTIKVGSLEYVKGGKLTNLNFKLIDESINSEIKIESKEDELSLNRNHLDPNNSSISGEEHILLKFKNGNIYITDVSSNGATFIQAKSKMPLTLGAKLVLGNKFFLFTSKNASMHETSVENTQQLGQLASENKSSSSFTLVDEATGQQYNFQGAKVIIKRSNIDPSNTTFSSKQHAIIEYEENQWSIRDVSTNGATFKQITEEMSIENKTKLILGNKVFRFEYD